MDLLDKAKVVTGSDAETARLIGLSRFGLSHVRNGRRPLSPYQAARLAEICGERWHDHALPILAAMAKSEAEKEFWLGKSKTLAQIAGKATAGVLLTIGAAFLLPSGKAKASTLPTSSNSQMIDDVYIARRTRRRKNRNHKVRKIA